MRVCAHYWLVLIAATAGCSQQTPPAPAVPPPPAETVFDPLTRDLDRAKQVQKSVDQQADQTRQAVENLERGDAAN
jgi:hypothetical protein